MKFTVSVPTEILERMDERAAAAEVSRSEWVRRAILAYDSQAGQASGASGDLAALMAERERLTELLARHDREMQVLREEVQRETAEADRLRADLDLAQKMIARAEDEVAWLRALTRSPPCRRLTRDSATARDAICLYRCRAHRHPGTQRSRGAT